MKSNIIKLIITGVILAGAMVTTGVIAYNQGWDKGYNQGWHKGYDEGWESIREPRTDSEIWETYHDCDMYGLPEYAREQCNR